MESTPKLTLPDDHIDGLVCAICGAEELKVNHVDRYPDYVNCGNCGSAYVVEDGGERVMYGHIPDEYPETQRFAMRQWAWPEAIARKAVTERPPAAGITPLAEPAPAEPEEAQQETPLPEAETEEEESPDTVTPLPSTDQLRREAEVTWQPGVGPTSSEEEDADLPAPHIPAFESPFMAEEAEDLIEPFDIRYEEEEEEELVAPDWMGIAEDEEEPSSERPEFSVEELASQYWRGDAPVSKAAVDDETDVEEDEELETEELEEPEPKAAGSPEREEPLRGDRFRAVLQGTYVRFPGRFCAHCLSQPVRGRLAIPSSLPDPRNLERRKPATFQIPLCARCRRRAAARSDAERSARLQAHLISALVALGLIVLALGTRVVSFQDSPATDALILVILAVLGYGIAALLLLGRAGRHPTPPDAAYVQSTLITPDDAEPGRTAFEWRNRSYAEAFVETNRDAAVSEAVRVPDRTFLQEPLPSAADEPG